MENTNYYLSIEYYPQIINDISKLLSKAGHSVLQVKAFDNDELGIVYDIYIDHPLNEEKFNYLYAYALKKYNYFPLQLRSTLPIIRLIPVKKSGSKNALIKTLLLILTILTVSLTGYGLTISFNYVFNVFKGIDIIIWSMIYAVLFLSALSIHEAGHMFVSKHSNIVIDGPYFIPAPPIQLGFIGTLGAIINMKTLPPDRKTLARLGISGPLAGFIAGLLIGVIGVVLSPVIPVSKAQELIARGEASEALFLPLIINILLYFKPVMEGYTVFIHPILFVSIIIFLVTFLNLIPVAQLDGGHVIRSYISMETYEKIGYYIPLFLLLTGAVFLLTGLLFGGFFITLSLVILIIKYIFGRKPHPGPANQFSENKDYRYLILYVVILVLSMPVPVL